MKVIVLSIKIESVKNVSITNEFLARNKKLRQHQVDALLKIQEKLGEQRRLFLSIAIGTGKMAIITSAVKLFLKNGRAKRILIVTDRRALLEQQLMQIKEDLDGYYSIAVLAEAGSFKEEKIVMSTIQKLHWNEKYKSLHKDEFDVIICDVMTKSNMMDNICDYFSGFVIGFIPNENSYMGNASLGSTIDKELIFEYSMRPTFSNAVDKEAESEYKANIEFVTLQRRKKELEKFERLLYEPEYFETQCIGVSKEAVWQKFFEESQWIFGHGLNYIFMTSIDNKKLEQIIIGNTFNERGKRTDGLLKTHGESSFMCLVEIKTHLTKLLEKEQYRGDCWAISSELAGGISQIQKVAHKVVKKMESQIEIVDEKGDLTGESIFLCNPKAYLIIGNLEEFKGDHGTNKEKQASFEIFRRNLMTPEIITFDELYLRARGIIRILSQEIEG